MTDPVASPVLDQALAVLHRHAPEYGGGLSDHGPMVAEALCALGRADAVPAWLAGYLPRLEPAPADGTPPEGAAWREALGRPDRYPDLVALFVREIASRGWRDTARGWIPRLAPGLVGAAAHGVIRAGHAVHALAARDTPERRRELAQALGYWAATWKWLPGADDPEATPGAPADAGTERLPSAVLPDLERVADTLRGPVVFLTDALASLHRVPSFAGVIDAVGPDGDPSGFLTDLSRTAARVFVANAGRSFLARIATVHAVTATTAARTLAAVAAPAAHRTILRHTWQGVAALYVALAEVPPASDADVARRAGNAGDFGPLVARAIACGDEHAIKLVAACAGEHAVAPHPAYLAAAIEGVDQFERAASGGRDLVR